MTSVISGSLQIDEKKSDNFNRRRVNTRSTHLVMLIIVEVHKSENRFQDHEMGNDK